MIRQVDKEADEVVDRLVNRIIDSVRPKRIYIFGSAARGDKGPNSDIDVLVVMPDGVHRRNTSKKIYHSLAGMGIAKDIVVVTESDVRNYGKNPSLVIYPALEEGREVYHAAS